MKNDLMIFEHKEHAVVSSRYVAENFKKQHQHVTQAIEKLISENSLVKSMFIRNYYDTERGKTYKEYLMEAKVYQRFQPDGGVYHRAEIL